MLLYIAVSIHVISLLECRELFLKLIINSLSRQTDIVHLIVDVI